MNERAFMEQLLDALQAIAEMKNDDTTDHSQLSALCVAVARTAIAKAEGESLSDRNDAVQELIAAGRSLFVHSGPINPRELVRLRHALAAFQDDEEEGGKEPEFMCPCGESFHVPQDFYEHVRMAHGASDRAHEDCDWCRADGRRLRVLYPKIANYVWNAVAPFRHDEPEYQDAKNFLAEVAEITQRLAAFQDEATT